MPRPDPLTSRRSLLRVALLVAVLAAAGQPAASRPAGEEAHPPPAPDGLEMSGEMETVTRRVLCPCGTCVNQTLHECTCGTAAMERDKIAAALSGGRSAEAIVDDYVQRYGLQILNAPDKKGFNLLGWMVPFIATFIGLASLTIVLARWLRQTSGHEPAAAAPAPSGSAGGEEGDYRKRLEKELEEMQI